MSFESSYPTAVFCIIATEFCERFSFCGLRTILSIYLRNELLFSENCSTVIYHVFIMICYIVPLAGAVCADSILGRYSTILYFSFIYLVGNILMCMGAIPILELSSITLSAVGLLLISVGTGGIKPCVAAFGGDQFRLPDQKDLLQHFFSLFYFTINLGGFVGMILTPILRKWVSCFGDDTCYALGFGFPAALMVLSLVLFVMGKPWYRLKTPKENVMLQFFKCTMYALVKRCKSRANRNKRKHWLHTARDKYSGKLISDMKKVFAVLFLYIPLPIFWSLFDQQGSRWTFQASHMDGNVLGIQIVPDQMQVVNPAMVLILIPIFDKVINPWFLKLHVMENALHRMAVGGMFASAAFLSAGVLELVLETTYPKQPEQKHASVNIINTLPCDVKVANPFNGVQKIVTGGMHRFENIVCDNYTKYTLLVEASEKCGTIYFGRHRHNLEVFAEESQTDTVLIGINTENKIQSFITDPVDFQKSLSGKPRIRIAYIKSSVHLHDVKVSLKNQAGFQDIYFVHSSNSSFLADSAYMELPQGIYDCVVASREKPILYKESFNLDLGGVYSLVVRERNMKIEFFKLYVMSQPNTINILWLLPQYFLISVAEILFGVSGLEFSFTQAPKSMKTVTIAGWYLSVAIGNFLVILITQANLFKSQAQEFFLFAVVMIADMMVFIEMASNYKFVQLEADSSANFPNQEQIPLIQNSANNVN
ncbi:peptide transporter family 1-like [Zophobas morio]|uniref:peptide transporter family 1-like n=1 Tax=Zophobas morio TaxID=2755281 RepID=UPI003083A9E0